VNRYTKLIGSSKLKRLFDREKCGIVYPENTLIETEALPTLENNHLTRDYIWV